VSRDAVARKESLLVALAMGPAEMATLALEGVSKVFPRRVTAVHQLDLHVRDGELVVLVGPSGCGKTTTLRLIAGLECVSAGVIRIDGRDVNRVAPRDRNIALVPQDDVLYPHLSVSKNLGFGLALRHTPWWWHRWWLHWTRPTRARRVSRRRRAIARRVHSAATTLGIEHLLDRKPWQLSGGERQRVALGRAIVRQPAAFLFDEPLSRLDAQLRAELRRELKLLHQRLAVTTVYVTHDQVEAMTLGDRLVVMDRGRVQQIAPPGEVYERPKNVFVARFFGSPTMNLLPGRLTGRLGQPRFEGHGLSVSLTAAQAACVRRATEGTVVLGIRPEHVRGDDRPGIPDGNCVGAGRVTVNEMLGPETIVTLSLDNSAHEEITTDKKLGNPPGIAAELAPARGIITSVTRSDQTRDVGTRVAIRIEASHAMYFDGRTGEILD